MNPKQRSTHQNQGKQLMREIVEKDKERFQASFGNLLEGVQILGHDWRYRYLNASAERHNRRPNGELLGRKYMDMWPGIEDTHVFSLIKGCMEERVASQLENGFIYPDGAEGWFVLSIQPIPEGVFILSFEITERVRAEKQVAQMKRLYATLSQVNQTIVRVKEADDLYRSVCDVAVQFGEFSLAWIGLLDEASGEVKPVAANGLDVNQWPFPIINIHSGPYHNGMISQALHASTVMISEDIQSDGRTQSLHRLIQDYAFHSLAVVPFRQAGRTVGVLCLISSEAGFFKSVDEIRLLDEMGLDISFALDTMEAERIKRQWADAFEHCAHGIVIGDPKTNRIRTCNPAFAREQRGSIEEFTSMPLLEMYTPQDREQIRQFIAQSDRTGSVRFEANKTRKDGSAYPVQMDLVSVRDEQDNLLYRVATQQDISERKEAERALQESWERYKTLFESNPQPMWVYDLETLAFLLVNDAAVNHYGYSREEFLGMTLKDIRPVEDIPALLTNIEQEHARLQHSTGWKHRIKDGSIIDVEVSSHTLQLEGRAARLVIANDITARKRAEAERNKLAERLDLATRSAKMGIWDWDIQKNELVWDELMYALYGLKPGQFAGAYEAWLQGLHPEDRAASNEIVLQAMHGEREYDTEFRVLWPDGSVHWLKANGQVFRNGDGKPLRMVGVNYEITERKQAEQAVHDSQARLAGVIDSAMDAIISQDEDQRIILFNPAAEKMFGCPATEALGQPLDRFLPERFRAAHREYVRAFGLSNQSTRDMGIVGPLTCLRASGEEFPAEITISQMHLNGQKIYTAILRDSTERVQAQQELQELQSILSMAEEVAQIGSWKWDLRTQKVTWSDQMFRLFDVEREGFDGDVNRVIAERIHPDDWAAVQESNRGTIEEANPVPLSYRIVLPGGGERVVWAQGRLVRDEARQPVALTGYVQDITERKQAEIKLAEALKFTEQILRSSPVGILTYKFTGECTSANAYAAKLVGTTVDELKRQNFRELESWKKSGLFDLAEQAIISGKPAVSDFHLISTFGKESWFNAQFVTFRSSGANLLLLTVADITERKQVEETVRENERQMRALVTSMDDIVFELDGQGTYLNIWTGNETLLAQPKAQMLGRRTEDVLGEESGRPITEAVKRVLAGGQPETIEYPLAVMGGQRWFLAHISPILAPEDKYRTVSMLVRDITEHKQAEIALGESEQRFRRLFITSPDAVLLIDPNDPEVSWPIVDCNEAACRMNGYAREELIGQSINLLNITIGTHEERIAYLDQLRREEVVHSETHHRHKDGHVFPIEVSTSLINFEGRELVMGIDRDITERKRAEEALRESETRFRSLVENGSDEISIISANGELLYESPSANPTLGYPPGKFLEQNIFQLIHPDDVEHIQEQFARLMQDPGLHPREQFRLRHQNGGWCWVEAVGTNLLAEPSVRGIVINYHDVTERRQAEEALRESENRFRLATRATNDVIWEWNAKMHELIWSENARVVFGYSPEQIRSNEKWWDEHIHPEDRERILSKMDALIAGNESHWSDEYRFQRQDGFYAYVSDRGYIEREASGNAIRMVGAMSDITEPKQAEQQIKLQLQRMSALSEIDRAISSSLDMRLSLDIVLSQVLSQLGVDAAAILLLNQSNLNLEYYAEKGFRSLAIRRSRMRLGEGIAGQVGFERRLFHVSNLPNAGSQFIRADLLKNEGFLEYFGVPLIAKGLLKGVLEIFNRSPLELDPEWMDYLETLGGQAAIAIDNAQLFEGMQKSNLELVAAYDATIAGWSHAMDLRDNETEGHSQRVAELTLILADRIGISEQEQVHIRRGALLHDIGKLGIPDHILLKTGTLTEQEWDSMHRHPIYAFEMLSPISYLRPALDIPYCHHEKWDGTGYPRGLRGEQIPLAARIFAVVDVWDALTSARPYRAAWSKQETLAYIKEQSGRHFDPSVVDVFVETIGVHATPSANDET